MSHPRDDHLKPQAHGRARPKDDAAHADDRMPDESRSFDTDAPPGGHMGSAGDPAEGKRD
ncbi:hypothetical protein [Phenylobacterium sp. NIBR 498073]|uniref:hypothetical protein n=1 Tax=Phenylobacterium sp. NIBR 498073 TaxID=3015177 RepID=UPI0022B57D32|nr:hypothetical protein [Phenylobacterium sp. NIBR 498073]WGU39860.1 hypothetical protein O4N75_19795 [Phenylobacterium sp. NIBR 498073]